MASNSYGMQSSVAFGRFISYFRGFKCSTNGSHANHGLRARSLDDIFCTELSHVTCRGICRVSIRFANVLDSFFQLFGDQLFQEADTTETSHHASSFELIFRMDFPHHVEASTFFLLCFTKLLDSQITRKRHGAQAPSYALHKLGGQGRNVATPPQNPPVSKP
jgi:hypothetical protein